MSLSLEKIQHYLTRGAKIFFVGMVFQFFAHTVLTHGIGLPSWLSFIWLWKEIIIILMGILALRGYIQHPLYKKKLLSNRGIIISIIIIILAMIVSLGNSVLIHGQSIVTYAVSAKYNFFPLIIAIVGLLARPLLDKQHYTSILNTIVFTIKGVIIFSLFRYIILNTIPNILDRIGFAQPGMSIERSAGSPPPSLYLTEFYSGYVRNQGPFGGPLSLGFYLVVLRPLFFKQVVYKKNFSDTWGWWVLYISIVRSTFSRAAWGMFLISCVLLSIVYYKQYAKYIIGGGLVLTCLIIIYILGGGDSQLFVRTRSDQGHIEFFKQGVALVRDNRLRGLGAASVGPGSHHITHITEVFNPENQYMQIWLEYGMLGLLSWLLAYITLIRTGLKTIVQCRWHQVYLSEKNTTHLIAISIISLAIGGIVLHPFTDSSSMYPFMLLVGLLMGGATISHTTISTNDNDQHIPKQDTQSLHQPSQINNFLTSDRLFGRLKIRTIMIGLFFTIQTIIIGGFDLLPSTIIASTLRDSIRYSIFAYTLWKYKHLIINFIKQFPFVVIPLFMIILINIIHLISGYYSHEWLYVIAGIKYDISYLLILGSSIRLGFLFYHKRLGRHLKQYTKRFSYYSIILIGIGIIRQVLKYMMPDIFIDYLGFSSPSDFVPFTNPPLYYLTGPSGVARLNGLFIGPNTLGFFIILCSPLRYHYVIKPLKQSYQYIALSLYILVLISTFSRGAILGAIIVSIIYIIINSLSTTYKKNNFLTTMIDSIKKSIIPLITIMIVGASSILFIQQRKESSNAERFGALSTIEISQQISLWGKGPGYLGPARHYESSYYNNQKNTFSLIENIYLQTLINQGMFIFICITIIITSLGYIHFRLGNTDIDTQLLGLGLLGLLGVGFSLHIFIDSMVNYLFFTLYGLHIGYYTSILSIQKTQ